MTEEQRIRLALLVEQINAAYEQVHAVALTLYDDGMEGATDIDTRALILEAEMRLDTAAERLAQLAKQEMTA